MKQYRPVALIILDGWGIREMAHGNAVVQAQTPNYDRWLREYERCVLDASGEAVGLPQDQMGNSEVGHLNLGAGRIVYQDFTRINLSISDESFYEMSPLLEGVRHAQKNEGKVHILGLLGPGGVHSHVEHLYATIRLANKEGMEPVLHIITDGRDTPPRSGLSYLQEVEAFLEEHPATIATVSGRYYAMDRDNRWQRTERAYRALVQREGRQAPSAQEAIKQSYNEDVTDEFIVPTVIDVDRDVAVTAGDTIVFYNFRADRMRQIVKAFVMEPFEGFERARIDDLRVVTFTSYEEGLPTQVVFSEQNVDLPLAAVLSDAGLTQFHAAETEKYAHVTYFFNGGQEKVFAGEERHLEPSPQVATYDLQPEMSAEPLTEKVLARLEQHDDAFILVNYANPDMVGHTGDLQAAIRACEAVDACAGQLVQAVLDKGGVALVTADHGNAERMIDEEKGGPHTYHTTSPVSFIIIAGEYIAPRPQGILADVAPTVLALLGLEQPQQMTGRSILEHKGL
ncbi:MAG TPA: 2,3-bisphosphoglycerate-independent phosphoglycerate mutase [Candidatus Sulfomarinibacteraceae bacterium]|nr:2,3-bisphosphoglycerate-independent phosphoglycerate mutase [Candidatus Sulfomarinibacteraceae bacterium]